MERLPAGARVFLSYATDDERRTRRFRQFLYEENDVAAFDDCSVRDGFRENWRQEAWEKIAACDVVACLIGEKTYLSEPVNWEIETALGLGKTTLAYVLPSAVVLPPALRDNGIRACMIDLQPDREFSKVASTS